MLKRFAAFAGSAGSAGATGFFTAFFTVLLIAIGWSLFRWNDVQTGKIETRCSRPATLKK
jgi:hypothetical protein